MAEYLKGIGPLTQVPQLWMAGGGVKGGFSHGSTDDYGTAAIENGVERLPLVSCLRPIASFGIITPGSASNRIT